ncbi:MAG: hypothetical protein AAGA87_16860 [Pseudomonadota bacterium]
MTRQRRKILWTLGLTTVAMLAIAVATVKPIRILAPRMFGMVCPTADLCIDDIARLEEAARLRDDAIAFVERDLGPLGEAPTFLFCAKRECFARFADPAVAALYFWGAGTVLINEHGWEAHILRHEVIHHWQKENLGGARTALGLPRWYIEGMAYTLSDDPRAVIPNEQADGYRSRFRQWIDEGNESRSPPPQMR